MTFAQRLQRAKAASGHSIRTLAGACGTSTTTVEAWLYTGQEPGAYHLRRLCRALNVSADYLLGLSESEE